MNKKQTKLNNFYGGKFWIKLLNFPGLLNFKFKILIQYQLNKMNV